jgi:hypothetical protein
MMKFKRKTITKNQKNTKQAKQVNQTLWLELCEWDIPDKKKIEKYYETQF